MPYYAHREGRPWHPKGDFLRPVNASHCYPEPTTRDGLVDLMDDMGAVDGAEVYRFVKPELMREIIDDAAERVELDLRGDYYKPAEAVYLFMSRQALGQTRMCVVIDEANNREILFAS